MNPMLNKALVALVPLSLLLVYSVAVLVIESRFGERQAATVAVEAV